MPLKTGYGKKTFKANVAKMIHEGRETDQALAVAYSQQRRSQKKAGKPVTPKR